MLRFILVLFLLLAATACAGDSPSGTGPTIGSVVLNVPANTVALGTNVQVSPTVRDINGALVNGATIQWISRAAQIATVSSTGVVTGRAAGGVRIVAIAGAARDSVSLTVVDDGLSVSTTNQSFIPFSLTVPVGSDVRFLIYGITHNVVFDDLPGAPASIPATDETTVVRRFNTMGTFPFECTLHPGMSGQIIVN